MAITGECLSGGIQFDVASVPMIGLCHCSRCRKAYGGPFAIEAVIPSSGELVPAPPSAMYSSRPVVG